MVDIRISLQPKQRELARSIEDWPVTFFGGARGGGKSHGLREILLLRRFQYPGSVGGIFRRSYPELEANHITPIFNNHPELRDYYNDSKKTLTLPNGSILRFCYCEADRDILRYQGQEFHDLDIEEAGQWTESEFRTLHGSNRSSNPQIKPRCVLTGNPGGIGHAWLKRLFIERRFKETERPQDYHFIQSLVKDNAALMHSDPDYVHRLNAETNPLLRKAYLEGDWDLTAGQYFDKLSRDIHYIKAFPIPFHWNRFGAYDFGFNHPAAFGWFATDEDGNVYLYKELVKAKTLVSEFAKEVVKMGDIKKLYPIVAGHDCFAKKGKFLNEKENPPTIAEEFQKHGITLKPSTIARVQGANQLRQYLDWKKDENGNFIKRPKFFIMDSCPITYDCLTRMIHDPDNIEDVLKVDSSNGDLETGDDPYDMTRYGLMTKPLLTEALPESHPIGSEAWAKQQAEKMEQEAEDHFERLEEASKGYGGWTP